MTTPSADASPGSPIAIVGGGLAGSLMSVYFARRGFDVDVYERRPDMRTSQVEGGRSINLALSERGLNALRAVGLEERIRELCIPMHGRMIHPVEGARSLQPYGDTGQYINSVSRAMLNEILMDSAEYDSLITYHFNKKCAGFSLETGALRFRDTETGEFREVRPSLVIGADGAFSAIRYRMQTSPNFEYQQTFLGHGYKELVIPAAPDGSWRMEKHALHIWPREDFMMIALPNLDGSFTCTLFMAFEGPKASFEALKTKQQVTDFFRTHFPDAVALMPTLLDDFFANPTGSLVTIRCAPYHWGENVLLIGDAAHAIVPFYGQGMNAAFEDCFELDRLITEHGPDWAKVLPEFTRRRKPNADAIAELALYNYLEMRDLVTSRWFLWRKKLEGLLHRWFPSSWIPLYTMITFTNIPYHQAQARARHQSELLTKGLWAAGGILIALILGVIALILAKISA